SARAPVHPHRSLQDCQGFSLEMAVRTGRAIAFRRHDPPDEEALAFTAPNREFVAVEAILPRHAIAAEPSAPVSRSELHVKSGAGGRRPSVDRAYPPVSAGKGPFV